MKKILVIEDNKDISSILKKLLEKNMFAVDVAETGYAVLAYLQGSKEPAAVVLDLFIPERSGIDLLDSLVSAWPYTKIFVYSAHSEWKTSLERYPGVCRFFCKTDGMGNLIKAIQEELGV
ncbi:MAG: response regulator [Candidatus Omnitrophota bacterium]|nr:response regulator [Candidatus Omnitrophota bacterium]